MKKLSFLFQLIWVFTYSQEINWSNVYEQRNSNGNLSFIGKTNAQIFLITQETKGLFSSSQKSILVFSDSTLLFVKKIPIEIESNDNQLNYLGCLIINNQLFSFYSNLVDNNSQIFSRTLVDNKWSKITLVCTVPFSEYSQINFNYFNSNNSLLFYGVRKSESNKLNEFCAVLVNYNSKKEMFFSVALDSEHSNFNFMESKSDSCCSIILLADYYQKKTFSLNEVIETPIAIKLNTKNADCKIVNLKSFSASSEFAYLIDSNKGILLNRENGKPVISIMDFLSDVSSKVMFNSEPNATSQQEEDYAIEKNPTNIIPEKELKNLKIKKVFQLQDSSLIVVCEQSWKERICNSLNYRFGGVQCFDYYYSMDLLVFYFSAKGKLEKTNRVQKPQLTVDDRGVYNSIMSLEKNNQVFVLYNDEPSNPARKSGRLKTMMYPMSSALVSITINKNGLLNSQRLSNSKQENIIFRPSKSSWF